jgi:hypothetical protein
VAGSGSRIEQWNVAIARELRDHGMGSSLPVPHPDDPDQSLGDLRGRVFVVNARDRAAKFAIVPTDWSLARSSIIYGMVVDNGGTVALDSLTINPGPITSKFLASVRVNDVLGRVLREIVSDDQRWHRGKYPLEGLLGSRGESVDVLADAARRTKLSRPGRRPFDDDHYFEVARTYLYESASGSREELAAIWSARLDRLDPPIAEQTIARWIGECRRRKILAKTSVGRGARMPGPRYEALKRRATK